MRLYFLPIILLFPLFVDAQDIFHEDSLDAAFRETNYTRVIQLSEKVIQPDSLAWRTTYAIGSSYLHEYNPEKAIQYLELANSINPGNSMVLRSLAAGYEAKGSMKQAIETYKACLEIDSMQFSSRLQLASILEDRGQYPDALKHYLWLVKNDTANYYFTRQAANCYKKLNNMNKAIDFYKKSIDLNPMDITSAVSLINLLVGQGELDSAKVYADNAYILDTNDVRIIRQNAYIYYLKANYEMSGQFFQKAILNNDSSRFTYKYLGMACYKNSYYESAILALQKAFSLDTTDAEVAYFIGVTYGKMLEEEKGIEYLDKARRLIIPSKDVMINIYSKLGELHNAIGEYNMALVDYLTPHGFYPDDPVLLFFIAVQYDYMTNYGKALKYYERFLNSTNPGLETEIPDGLTISYNEYARQRVNAIKEEMFFKGELEE